jgi:hypothetical protein
MPTIHTLRTRIRVPVDIGSDPDRTVVETDIVFTFEASPDPDFSATIAVIHARSTTGAPINWLREAAQSALTMDDAFYDACVQAAETDRGR